VPITDDKSGSHHLERSSPGMVNPANRELAYEIRPIALSVKFAFAATLLSFAPQAHLSFQQWKWLTMLT
jgi:hypothetical protein